MAKQQDYTAVFKDIMGAFPVDNKAMEDAFKTQAALGEKMSKVHLDAAEKSTELSSKWMKDTLSRMESLTSAKKDPADYAKSIGDFTAAFAESTAEHMAAYAEIAKRVQSESVELMLAAGKDMGEDFQAAAKKASSEMTAAAKKASK